MKITYDPLWKTLIDKNMNKGQLQQAANLSKATITKMGKDESVTLETILKICESLQCGIIDVVDIVEK